MNAKRITALALVLVMTLLLAACGSKTVVNDDGTKTEQTERGVKVTQTATKAEQTERGVKVTQTAAKAVQTEKYETADFSMTIPKGWTVTTGGTNIYHSIRVSTRMNRSIRCLCCSKPIFFCTVRLAKMHGNRTTAWGIPRRRFLLRPLCLITRLQRAFSKYSHSILHLHRRWSLLIRDMPSPGLIILR